MCENFGTHAFAVGCVKMGAASSCNRLAMRFLPDALADYDASMRRLVTERLPRPLAREVAASLGNRMMTDWRMVRDARKCHIGFGDGQTWSVYFHRTSHAPPPASCPEESSRWLRIADRTAPSSMGLALG